MIPNVISSPKYYNDLRFCIIKNNLKYNINYFVSGTWIYYICILYLIFAHKCYYNDYFVIFSLTTITYISPRFQCFLEILYQMLQNFWRTLNTCFFDTICITISLADLTSLLHGAMFNLCIPICLHVLYSSQNNVPVLKLWVTLLRGIYRILLYFSFLSLTISRRH